MVVFFGAGKIGRNALSIWRAGGLKVDYFCDNNPELFGKEIESIKIISLDNLLEMSMDFIFFIVCKDAVSVYEQLIKAGVKKEQIKLCNTIVSITSQSLAQSDVKFQIRISKNIQDMITSKVIFELSAGLVLGGVERWSIQNAERLEKLGWPTTLLVHNRQKAVLKMEEKKLLYVELHDNMTAWDKLERLVSSMVCARYINLICNFASYNFAAACIAKKLFFNNIRIIAVVHNDEEIYYRGYVLMEQYIDYCLVISRKIRSKLIKLGFSKEKILYLPWEIPCVNELHRSYSQKNQVIRLGYAGRIVVLQKRLDLLISMAKKLKKHNVKFILELAGTGDFENDLIKEIEMNDLQEEVHCLGMLKHDEIRSFWNKQDIMVSCSDWEGHSISQCEAMSAGTVPIVTDVSGVRDDIIDSENGFIVEIGAVDQLVERILFLYDHRELLPIMGRRAYESIKEKNNAVKIEQLWKSILI